MRFIIFLISILMIFYFWSCKNDKTGVSDKFRIQVYNENNESIGGVTIIIGTDRYQTDAKGIAYIEASNIPSEKFFIEFVYNYKSIRFLAENYYLKDNDIFILPFSNIPPPPTSKTIELFVKDSYSKPLRNALVKTENEQIYTNELGRVFITVGTQIKAIDVTLAGFKPYQLLVDNNSPSFIEVELEKDNETTASGIPKYKNIRLKVINSQREILSAAKIKFSNQTLTLNNKGELTLRVDENGMELLVECDGYLPRNIELNSSSDEQVEVILTKVATSKDILEQANILYESKKYDEALELYKNISSDDVDEYAQARNKMANIYSNQRGDINSAISMYSQIISLPRENLPFNYLAGAYYNRGLLFSARGELNNAFNDLREALKLIEKLSPVIQEQLLFNYIDICIRLYNTSNNLSDKERYCKEIIKSTDSYLSRYSSNANKRNIVEGHNQYFNTICK